MPDTPIVIALAAVIIGVAAALIARVRRAGGGHGQSSDSGPVTSGDAWTAGGLFGGHSDRDRSDDDRSGNDSDSGGWGGDSGGGDSGGGDSGGGDSGGGD